MTPRVGRIFTTEDYLLSDDSRVSVAANVGGARLTWRKP